ncbi:hypothetical protein PRIPAC_81285 [Pristionchus pacificus]|uniref:Uncharacterized protein n=1 Tax=Pristionchus pacificus TaxID=54126 RepID=A0A2A6C455_PRIPA|nr:hypothetical protein PRIPAC_81285 [Pristionchus pacificus]|eukprot:PDM72910.1 hypothetical protein PRIPAC_39344 [Pristionchus pacificus]
MEEEVFQGGLGPVDWSSFLVTVAMAGERILLPWFPIELLTELHAGEAIVTRVAEEEEAVEDGEETLREEEEVEDPDGVATLQADPEDQAGVAIAEI